MNDEFHDEHDERNAPESDDAGGDSTIVATALNDPKLQALRRSICALLIERIHGAASWLDGDGRDAARARLTTPPGDDPIARRFLGVSAVVHMAFELALGSAVMLQYDLTYSGQALVRQLIETEYLLYLFAEDPDEADQWLTSTPAMIRKKFKPGDMRKRSHGRFADSEYWAHCDRGGHPAPSGIWSLNGWVWEHAPAADAASTGLHDLTQHLHRIWITVRVLMTRQYPDYTRAHLADVKDAESKIAAWFATDPIAGLQSDTPVSSA